MDPHDDAKEFENFRLTAIHEAGHAFMNEEDAIGTYDAALAGELWPQVVEFLHAELG